MGLCTKASCTVNNLCRNCRKLYPATAASNDRERREQRGGGRVARGIAAAGMIGAIGGVTANPQQSDTTTQKNWGDSSLRSEVADNRDNTAELLYEAIISNVYRWTVHRSRNCRRCFYYLSFYSRCRYNNERNIHLTYCR